MWVRLHNNIQPEISTYLHQLKIIDLCRGKKYNKYNFYFKYMSSTYSLSSTFGVSYARVDTKFQSTIILFALTCLQFSHLFYSVSLVR